MMNSVVMGEAMIEKLKPARIIKDHSKDIVGIDFSNDGDILYIADSQTLNVVSTSNAQTYRRLHMKVH